MSDVEFEASLTELRELAKTLGCTVTRSFTQKRSGFDATAYLGVGKRQKIRRFVNSEPGSERVGAQPVARVLPWSNPRRCCPSRLLASCPDSGGL